MDGKRFGGELLYPGDRIPTDIDQELLHKLRNIGWIEDVPAAQWQPPSEALLAARQERLQASERRAEEELEHQRALAEERARDPVLQAQRRIMEADQAVRDAEHERQLAVMERDKLLRERPADT